MCSNFLVVTGTYLHSKVSGHNNSYSETNYHLATASLTRSWTWTPCQPKWASFCTLYPRLCKTSCEKKSRKL